MIYQVAERFKSIQGEGVFAGTPMAFIRFVGCSVGKKICNACDTDFEKPLGWRGGGSFYELELLGWARPYTHICLTGGEPLDQDFDELFNAVGAGVMFHVETSGTRDLHSFILSAEKNEVTRNDLWICVSPKPGFLETAIVEADEIKVIVPGLGSGEGWPTITDALRWADAGKIVFLQPRNGKHDVDRQNLMYVQDIIREFPQLRLSLQLHKLLKVQ